LPSILDLLIAETASVLGITPDEVKSRFTKEQLDDLLNSSLCEPVDESGPTIESLDVPCEDPLPQLLPPVDLSSLDELEEAAQEQAKKTLDKTKCIDKVEEVNATIDDQLKQYLDHKTLHDKLVEYEDNFAVLGFYFRERSEEVARVLDLFQPLLLELETIDSSISDLNRQRNNLYGKLGEAAVNDLLGNIADIGNAISQLDASELSLSAEETEAVSAQIRELTGRIDALRERESEIRDLLDQREEDLGIFDNSYYQEVLNFSSDSGTLAGFGVALSRFFNDYIGPVDRQTFSSQILSYSSCISVTQNLQDINSIQDLVERSFFDFKIRFPKLNFLPNQREEYDRSTGNRQVIDFSFPIKTNPILEKTSFFNSNSIFELSEFVVTDVSRPTGILYQQFYDLLEDPLNNFFSEDERGLTKSINLIDPRVRGTAAQIKKEKDTQFYVKNLDVMQNFYSTADSLLEARFAERRTQTISSAKEAIRITVSRVARKEARAILALRKVNRYLLKDSVELSSTVTMLNQQNEEITQAYFDLTSEILRISQRADELKPSPTKIRDLLKESSPECFGDIDSPPGECPDVKQKLGTDPLFIDTLSGVDPTLPTHLQLCYWKEFSKLANVQGLFPLPNLPQVTKLRYWPVGLVIPTPVKIIKIPLPITWIPLLTISTPLGVIVIFLTINGIFISPVVFFISSTGFKQHILTVRGSSEKFGYSSEDESVKPGVYSPLALLSSTARQSRLSSEAEFGKNFDLSPQKRQDIVRQDTILTRTEQIAAEDGNENKLDKVSRERENFNEASDGLTLTEKFENLLNKRDEAADSIKKAKRSIFNRLNELGAPQIQSINSLKERIVSRRADLLSSLQQSLEIGDLESVKRIRQELNVDGISLSEKIGAIEKDLQEHYKKLKFPKIVIPNDYSTIDPKKNAVFEFADFIRQFSEMNGTRFFTARESSVRNLFLIRLAKTKGAVLQETSGIADSSGKINLETEPEKARTILTRLNKKLADGISGKDESVQDVGQQELDDLKEKLENEQDPVKQRLIKTELEKKSTAKQEFLSQETQKLFLSITPQTIASLGQLSVEFDPFAPCCQKETFSLPLGESPALAIIASTKAILDTAVSQLDTQSLKSLVGGRSLVTPNEIASAHINIIKKAIPAELTIPLPDLNVATVAATFSSIFLALFEPKAPIDAAQPALPTSITIDLNLLKSPLLSLLLGFLRNCLPDPNSSPTQSISIPPSPSQTSSLSPGLGGEPPLTQNKAVLDPKIEIIFCDPDTSEDSILSGGSQQNRDSGSSDLGNGGLGSAIIRSNRDVLPSFQTLDTDFLSVNPSDLLAVMRNFVDLQFSKVENQLSSFYSLLNTVRGLDGMNLNVIEAAQQAVPPYGPPAKAAFLATATLKKSLPRASNFKIVDPTAAKQKIETVRPALESITSSPIAGLVIAGAGAADSALPKIKMPKVDTQTGEVRTEEKKITTLGLRNLHPLVSQDDIPSWERLSSDNPLFLLFLDEFVATGADQIGFFRSYV